jgi:hypothetical protein
MKNDIFWNVTSCGSCKIRRFGGTQHLHHQGDKNILNRNNASCNLQLDISSESALVAIRRLTVFLVH